MANVFKYVTCTNQDCKKRSTISTETKKVPKCTNCGADMKYARKWTYRFMHEYNIYKKTVCENKKDTQRTMNEHRNQLESGIVPNKKIETKRYTFEELAEKYRNHSKHQKGYESNKKYAINVLVRRYGKKFLDTFTTLDADELKTDYLVTHANRTANGYVVQLGHMIRQAVRWEMVSEEVLKKVLDVKKEDVNSRLRYLANDEERDALINACADHLRPMVKLALNTGMRRGEIFNLQWKNIDLNKGLIWIQSGESKNKKLVSIPINQTVKEILKSLSRRFDCPYVFYNEDGGKWNDVRTAFDGACRRAKIYDFRFHDLRHDFASNLVQRGVHLKVLQELMRHKTIEMTLKYAHLAPEDKATAVALLDKKEETPLTTLETLQAKIKELEKELTEKVA